MARSERAHDWERTGRLALLVAVVAAVGAVASSGSDAGDLITGLYFLAVGLCFWIQSLRVRYSRLAAPFAPGVRMAFTVAVGVGGLLAAVDLVSAGAL